MPRFVLRTISVLLIMFATGASACDSEAAPREQLKITSQQTAPVSEPTQQTSPIVPQKQPQTVIQYKPPPQPAPRPQLTKPAPPPTPVFPPPAPSPAPKPKPTPIPEPEPQPIAPAPSPAVNQPIVTRVIDGDTIEVMLGGIAYSVRYIGVDTPESGDWLYSEATELNKSLVLGKAVRLENDVSNKDIFGRLLRYLYVEDTLINAELVRGGLAKASSYPPDTANDNLFSQLQREAMAAGQGLWTKPQISFIFYDGLVPKVESDEYVEITNNGGTAIDITGWKLKDSDNHFFTFPQFTLGSRMTIRVYTNENHPEWGGFSFKSSTAIWNNSEDTAVLYDSFGQSISRVRYRGN